MGSGRLITIEGIDGVGKSTLAQGLLDTLRDRGKPVLALREPGGVAASERVRGLVKDPGLRIGARAEALLYAAARAQLVEEALVPALDSGRWVLLDRFIDSSLAYQGAGRGLGVQAVRDINLFGTGGVTPDRTLWLSLDPALARARAYSRGEPVDRLEGEQDGFFARIEQAYAQLCAAEPERIRRIDAAQTPDAVLAAGLDALSDLL